MKKRPIVHYGNAMKTPCGLYCVSLPTSKVLEKVTCKRCLKRVGNLSFPEAKFVNVNPVLPKKGRK